MISILSPPVTQSDESSLLLAVTGCSFSSNLTVQTSLWDSLLWSSHFYGHQSVLNYVWKSISATLSCKMCFVYKVWCDLTSWRYTQHLLWGMCWCLSGVNVQMIFKGDEKGVITNHETEKHHLLSLIAFEREQLSADVLWLPSQFSMSMCDPLWLYITSGRPGTTSMTPLGHKAAVCECVCNISVTKTWQQFNLHPLEIFLLIQLFFLSSFLAKCPLYVLYFSLRSNCFIKILRKKLILRQHLRLQWLSRQWKTISSKSWHEETNLHCIILKPWCLTGYFYSEISIF